MSDETTLEALEQWIGREFHPDYWSDDAILRAGELIDRLDPGEWEALVQRWPERPAVWQRNLADALTGSSQPGRDALLAALLGAPDATAARNAANSLIASRDWRPDAQARADLEALRDRLPEHLRDLPEELLAR